MRCINKSKALRCKLTAGLLCILMMSSVTGCGKLQYEMPYDSAKGSNFSTTYYATADQMQGFASNLCVVASDVLGDGSLDMTTCTAAVLFDVKNKEVVYAKEAHKQMNPSSLTKSMTALLALKYGNPDMVLTASDAVVITEAKAQVAGIKPGDSMTLYQALRILMLYSANDVAMLIAENLASSVDDFVDMMNKEALALGATNTHFNNPHGLTDPEHYTTAYDLYLIFQECLKYEEFVNIISTETYSTNYKNSAGGDVPITVTNTNGFLNGKRSVPENVNIIGGKTGTTAAAGHCLTIYATDMAGAPYIAIILQSDSTDSLYQNMSNLLSEMND